MSRPRVKAAEQVEADATEAALLEDLEDAREDLRRANEDLAHVGEYNAHRGRALGETFQKLRALDALLQAMQMAPEGAVELILRAVEATLRSALKTAEAGMDSPGRDLEGEDENDDG